MSKDNMTEVILDGILFRGRSLIKQDRDIYIDEILELNQDEIPVEHMEDMIHDFIASITAFTELEEVDDLFSDKNQRLAETLACFLRFEKHYSYWRGVEATLKVVEKYKEGITL